MFLKEHGMKSLISKSAIAQINAPGQDGMPKLSYVLFTELVLGNIESYWSGNLFGTTSTLTWNTIVLWTERKHSTLQSTSIQGIAITR